MNLSELRKSSQDAAQHRASKTNFLIYGDIGAGKTHLLKTAKKPLLLDNFDIGGDQTLLEEIQAGDVIVDHFEDEDAKAPSVFTRWEKRLQEKRQAKLFDEVGTYAIDSASTWSDSLMNAILKKEGRPATVPQLQDYNIHQIIMRDALKMILSLPCDVILTCHRELDKDEASGRMMISPLIGGRKGKPKMLLLFDEIYYLSTVEKKDGVERRLLTARTGLYMARTRIGRLGKLDLYEEADLSKLKAKAGIL